MTRLIIIFTTAIFGLLVSGCADTNINKELAGRVVGAAVGGLVGSKVGSGKNQLFAVGAGTFLGSIVGSKIGKSLDKVDRLQAARTQQQTLEYAPTGRTGRWNNPDSGNSGTYTPARTYRTAAGRYCREYQQTITVAGETATGYGTACRQPDGSWRLVHS